MQSEPDFRNVHRVAELFHELRNIDNPDALTKEAKRILGATAPEDEFMVIAIWSGRCSLVHKLPPDKYPLGVEKTYKIPDLFAVLEYEDRSIPVLIEVKSTYTKKRPGPIAVARLSPSYRRRLQNYGELLGLPVLVAQQIRPVGIWFIVALDTIGLDGKPTVDLSYDLSGLLFGTFHLAFRAGVKFVLRVEKKHIISDKEFEGVIRDAHWETADGSRIGATKSPMMLLFGLGDPVEKQDDDGKTVTITSEIPHSTAFANYQALRAAIIYDKQLRESPFPWAEMLKSGKFPISYASIEAAREDVDFFEREITIRPKMVPDFLRSV